MSESKFYNEMKDGFMDSKSETCCCGQCVDGWHYIGLMKDLVEDSTLGLQNPKAKAKQVDAIHHFYNYDYRWKHLKPSSKVSTHCCNHALASGSACLTSACDHTHENTCTECNMWAALQHEVLSELRDNHAKGSLTDIQLEVLEAHLVLLDDEHTRYVSHILRKHVASNATMVRANELGYGQALMWMDFKCKPLPREHLEGQSASFGKKGKSLCGIAAMFKIPVDWDGILPTGVEREGDFLITYIRIAADDSGQGVWHSIQAFMTGLLLLRKQYPFLHEGFLSSDGATNFKSLLFLLMLPHVSVRTGMKLLGHMLPEAGGGKDKCDRDFAGVNHLFNSWISQPGSSMMNADEICQALEAGKTPGVINCSINVQRDHEKEKQWKDACDTGKLAKLVGKSKDNLFYMHIVWDDGAHNATAQHMMSDAMWPVGFKGIRFFAYEGMGEGKFLSAAELRGVWQCDPPPILLYEPQFGLHGSKLHDVLWAPSANVKFELGREHKRTAKAKRNEMKVAKEARADAIVVAAEEAAGAKRTSKRCPRCEKPFLCDGWRHVHATTCKGRLQTVHERKMDAVNANSFSSLQGNWMPLPPQCQPNSWLSMRVRCDMLDGPHGK